MTDTWFSSSMDSLKDLHIANDLYAYNTLDGTNILLDHNNTIYMGDVVEDFLANTLHSE